MALKNNYLTTARKEKNDEFYTQYGDIESVVLKYKENFKNKTVYCPCDNEQSEFRNYFIKNYKELQLSGLYCSAIDGNTIYYNPDNSGTPMILHNGNIDITGKYYIELLKESDIVVTNPPFSLFIKFLNSILENKKDCLIVGQQNTITCKDVFAHIINGEISLDYNFPGIAGYFKVPNNYKDNATAGEHREGLIRVSGVIWYTTLKQAEEKPFIKLTKSIKDTEYKTFKNFRKISGLDEDCINVNKVKDIPYDYYGYMGVPISFFGKYNPKQFELIQMDHYGTRLGNQDNIIIDDDGNEKQTYRRIYIRLRKHE